MSTTTKPGVVLVMPTTREVPPETVNSFAGVYGRGLTDGNTIGRFILGDTYADVARNLCVTHAMDAAGDPTHIMWFDSDQTMPDDTIARLLSHNKAVVGGLYHQRLPPFYPVAYNFIESEHEYAMELIELDENPTGLVKVDGLGLGCTLARLDVYLAMTEHYAVNGVEDACWHQLSPGGSASERGKGEDVFFFRRLRDMGVDDVWLDCDLRVGHVRREVVGIEHYEAFKKVHPRTRSED